MSDRDRLWLVGAVLYILCGTGAVSTTGAVLERQCPNADTFTVVVTHVAQFVVWPTVVTAAIIAPDDFSRCDR